MPKKTIVIRKFNKMYGGYEYLEFSTDTKEFTTGNSSAHVGHGNVFMYIETTTKKEMNKQLETLKYDNYKKIDTFAKVTN